MLVPTKQAWLGLADAWGAPSPDGLGRPPGCPGGIAMHGGSLHVETASIGFARSAPARRLRRAPPMAALRSLIVVPEKLGAAGAHEAVVQPWCARRTDRCAQASTPDDLVTLVDEVSVR